MRRYSKGMTSYHLLPPGLLVASSLAGQGGIELPFASTTPMARGRISVS